MGCSSSKGDVAAGEAAAPTDITETDDVVKLTAEPEVCDVVLLGYICCV